MCIVHIYIYCAYYYVRVRIAIGPRKLYLLTPCFWISTPNFCRGCEEKTLMLILGGDWRGSEDDIRGRDASVAVRVAAELSVAATRAPGQRLSILIFPARQSLWLVLSDVSSTMHYVLYVCVCCLHIIISWKAVSVNVNVHHIFLFSYLPIAVAALEPLGALAVLGQPPTSGAPANITFNIYNSNYHRRSSFHCTDLVPCCTAPRRECWCGRGRRCPPGSGESAGLGGRSTRGPGAREIGRAARLMRSGQTQTPGERQQPQSASSRF